MVVMPGLDEVKLARHRKSKWSKRLGKLAFNSWMAFVWAYFKGERQQSESACMQLVKMAVQSAVPLPPGETHRCGHAQLAGTLERTAQAQEQEQARQ